MWKAAPSAILPSLLHVAFNGCLGPGLPLRSPPGTPLPSGRSVPMSFPPGGRQSGPPSETPLGPWALQWGVLWWHRMPSSSQGPSSLDQGGPVPHVSQVGGWPLSPVFPLLGPGRGSVWRFPPGWRRLWCRRWPATQITTPVGVTSAVLRKRTAGDYRQPLTGFPPTLSNPESSPPTRFTWPPCCQRNLQGTVSR